MCVGGGSARPDSPWAEGHCGGGARFQRPGAPALSGSLSDVVLDVYQKEAGFDRDAPARDFAAYLGVEIVGGVLTTVEENSEAAQAGLIPGDKIHEIDSVHLLSDRDFAPRAHGLYTTVEFSRPGFSGRASAQISRSGFQATDPVITARALALALSIALALCFAARPPRMLVWLVQRRKSSGAQAVSALFEAGFFARAAMYAVLFLVLGGLWLLLSVSKKQDFDLPLLVGFGVLSLLLAAFFSGGARSQRPGARSAGFSVVGALLSTLSTFVALLPVLFSFALWAAELGSLRLEDAVRAQGLLPMSWGLFRTPWLCALGVLYLLSLLPQVGRRPPLLGHRGPASSRGTLTCTLEWAGQLTLLGVWIVLFMGGTAGAVEKSITSGVLLSSKFILMLLVLGAVRERAGQLRFGESLSLYVGRVTALSSALVVLGLWAIRQPFIEGARPLLSSFSLVFAAALLVLVAISALRSLSHRGRRTDPWI